MGPAVSMRGSAACGCCCCFLLSLVFFLFRSHSAFPEIIRTNDLDGFPPRPPSPAILPPGLPPPRVQ